MRKQRMVLKHQTDTPLMGRDLGDITALPNNLTTDRLNEPSNRAQQGRLATTAWPNKREHFAGCDSERYLVDGSGLAITNRDSLDRERHNIPPDVGCSRSLRKTTSAVTTIRITDSAMA